MALPQGFRPSLSPTQVRNFQRLYGQQPEKFDEKTVESLKQHSEYYRFSNSPTDSFPNEVKNIMGQAGKGFFEGYTTLKAGAPPENEAQAIARNVGHLAGFVGFIPSTPLKMLGFKNAAQAVKGLKGTSIPMRVATAAQTRASAAIRKFQSKALDKRLEAKNSATSFLQSDIARDLGAGAFHLGVASAVSSWQGGIDEMVESAIYGAGAGAVFRGIGNAVKTGNEAADKTLRGIAGSMFQGLPSSIRGDTTPMQVYNYLLGGYFGANESPISKRLGDRHIAMMRNAKVRDPELVPGWGDYSSTTKKYIIDNYSDLPLASPGVGAKIAESQGIDIKKRQELGEKFSNTREELKQLEDSGEVKRGFAGEKSIEVSTISEDIDPQIVPGSLSQKSKSFVDRFITSESNTESINNAVKIEKKWNSLVKESRETGENPGRKMEDFVLKEFNEQVSTEGLQDFWTNLGQRKMQEEPVKQIKVVDGEKIDFLPWSTDFSTTNAAGNKKFLVHPPKPMELIYNKDANLSKKESSYAVLDHIVRKTAMGHYTEIPLDRYVSYMRRIINNNPNKYGRTTAEEYVQGKMAEVFSAMNKKGYYYFGGKGDSTNLFFQKFHPLTPKKNITPVLEKTYRSITTNGTQRKAFLKDRNLFIFNSKKQFGSEKAAKEYYDKSFISNIIYDIRMNGFETSIKGNKIENINKVLSEGFINDATNFNKRAQILLTNGYAADSKVVKNIINKNKRKDKITEEEDDGLKYKLIEDIGIDLKPGHPLGTPNLKHFQSNDGLIYAPDYVIKALNQQAGLPTEGGVNKSFIYSPDAQNGALLGKYMIHPAGKKLTEFMEKEKIHMIIPKSAAKQVGFRNKSLGKLTFKRTNYSLDGGVTYNLPIKNIKVIMSEITGKKDLQNKRMPEQLWTNFTPYSFFDPKRSKINSESEYQVEMQRIFDDMYEDLVKNEINGKEELNTAAENFQNNPKALEKEIPFLIENMDKIGMDTLLKTIKSPGSEKFANRAYQRILKMNNEIIENIKSEGELTNTQVESLKRDMLDFSSINERVIRLMPDSVAGFLHKFPRDYRMTVMRNYFLHRITRPTIGNSLSARMRPYEPEMAKDKTLGILEKQDNVFFLGDNFKEMKVDASGIAGSKNISLEKLWESGKNSPAVQEFFNAVVVRVPMDSMSGAHKLKFGGFTGIKDNGVLMHGRSLEALGGADLDGDKAFVFFGGKSASGKGEGFKADWKNLYDWSKNEYLGKDNIIKEGKAKQYSDELTVQDQEVIKNRKENKILQYSPNTRREVSMASAEGRGRLGTAVTQASYFRSAYAAIRNSENGYFDYNVLNNKGEVQSTIRMIPKTDNKSLQTFRERTKASIGLSSDPMNEAGLNFKPLMELQAKTLFDFKYVKNGRVIGGEPTSKEINLYRANNPLNVSMEINNALYGKNFNTGQRHQMWEILDKLELVESSRGMPTSKQQNTFLPKIAQDVRGLSWSDKIFNRITREQKDKVYQDYAEIVESLDSLKDVLGRNSMRVIEGRKKGEPRLTDLVYEFGLYKENGIAKQLGSRRSQALENEISKITDSRGEQAYPFYATSRRERRRALNEIVLKAEDYLIQDLTDIASFKVVNELSKNMSAKDIKKIAAMVDKIKKDSYVFSNRHNKNNANETSLSKEELARFQEVSEGTFNEPQSRARDQFEIDYQIRIDKQDLPVEGKKLYDALMLSSIWKGKMDVVKEARKKYPDRSPEFEKKLNDLETESSKTSLSRVGYASNSIPDSSVKRMLSEYQKLFDRAVEKSDPKFKEESKNKAENIDKVIEGGTVIEDPYRDSETGKYIDEYLPYLGLKKGGKLTKEEADVTRDIISHLDHYPNQIGKKLSGFFREVTRTDLNKANLDDFKIFRNYLNETRNGTWWSNILGKSNNDISKWYYYMFPKTIDMDIARKEIKLVKNRNVVSTIEGRKLVNTYVPEGMMLSIQKPVHEMTSQATETFERENALWKEKINPYIEGIEDGNQLWRFAQRERELGQVKQIRKQLEEKGMDSHAYNIMSKEYIDKYNQAKKELDSNGLLEKQYDIQVAGKSKKLTGQEVVNNIKRITNEQFEYMGNLIQGKKNKGDLETEFARIYGEFEKLNPESAEYKSVEKYIDKFNKDLLTGKKLDISIGLDGFQRLTHNQQVSLFVNSPEIRAALRKKTPEGTRLRETESFFPHYGADPKRAAKDLISIIENIDKNTSLSKAEKTDSVTRAIWQYKQLTRDFNHSLEPIMNNELVKEVLNDVVVKKKSTKEALNKLQKYTRIGSQLAREAHIPGWSVEPEIMSQYMKNVFDSVYKHAAQIKVNNEINKFSKEFYKKSKDIELTQRWVDFYTMYAQDAMGYPQQIPSRILNDPKMGIKGTPFAYINDTGTLNFVNKIRKKLGINEKIKGLPEEMKDFDFGTLTKWGNLEAKYQLATLLAHPKSAVANLYGGSVHTIVSTGLGHFRNARSIEYLKTNVNNEWSNMTDVTKWVQSLGVVEDFILYEAGFNPKFKQRNFRKFLNDAVDVIKKNPDASTNSLKEIGRKYGITDRVFNKAAWFMRRPERTLRRDAFMAHYLQAKDNFAGALKRFDDPILIKMGKEGVKSTQFLYSAPFRPAFARSSMGKALTRFQLWAWNSVRFRGDVLREARIRGFKEGTPEFDRFKRLATADLLMFGLANIFMYSIFENTLPQPWSWAQDLADWSFGNEKERSRAFFGTYPAALAPLQAITPPFARPLPGLFKAIINDDFSTLGGYYAWSMVPFGRVGYDVFGNVLQGGKGGLIENPYRMVEKVSGLPYQQIPRQLVKYRDTDMLRPGFLFEKDKGETEGKVT